MDNLNIEYIPVEYLKPYHNNTKIHTGEQIDKIKQSIELFGFNDPIALWHDNEIIEGHGRYIAALELGLEAVPCIRLEELTDDQRKAYGIVHNKLTADTGFDFQKLEIELTDIEINMEPFGVVIDDIKYTDNGNRGGSDWFNDRERNDESRQEGNDEYNQFLEKFEPKKTTDDCYTPDEIYEVIAEWVAKEYNVSRETFTRPFYPNGDYEKEDYTNKVVVDNPPFSILAQILQYYNDNNIKYFLFAPHLTLASSAANRASLICTTARIRYENGAQVATSFVTNLDTCRLRSAPELTAAINKVSKELQNKDKPELPTYEYPKYVITPQKVGALSEKGVNLRIEPEDCFFVRVLDEQRKYNKAIFGAGYLLSEKAAAEREAAEREAAEREAAEREAAEKENEILYGKKWALSDREMEIVRSLGKKEKRE